MPRKSLLPPKQLLRSAEDSHSFHLLKQPPFLMEFLLSSILLFGDREITILQKRIIISLAMMLLKT
jgi:hypothetical protein